MIKYKMIRAHLRSATAYATTSYAKRLQVGAVVVNQLTDQPVSAGWNGMPPGVPNICEEMINGHLVSKPDVVHAEINALSRIPSKAPREFLTLFCTDSPCPACAHAIIASGIRQVIFKRRYRLDEGVLTLLNADIEVFHKKPENLFQLQYANGRIEENPAPFTRSKILKCRNYLHGQTVQAYGLSKHHVVWSAAELDILNTMFSEGATVDDIARVLDRSYSSVCTRLSRGENGSSITWSAEQGYMITDYKRKRVLWCSINDLYQNQRAIEKAVERIAPKVKAFFDSVHDFDEVLKKYPQVAPMFLKRICKVNNQ
ncbi:dCMP deaminase [Erwinia phage vB_EamM-Bue1]|uniref:dCMP deaminase n=1 Tax=Erwinia phage vB_EamM-Bue1 TaxID=2099338 RepID=A0A2P1JU57_9CAUD|nr:dCMP deaminase [Erwinia phage vB_EamM-Bue1]AVO22863.1 dCMP deaminase [Erwinia phage vB_EamM-Bue1]